MTPSVREEVAKTMLSRVVGAWPEQLGAFKFPSTQGAQAGAGVGAKCTRGLMHEAEYSVAATRAECIEQLGTKGINSATISVLASRLFGETGQSLQQCAAIADTDMHVTNTLEVWEAKGYPVRVAYVPALQNASGDQGRPIPDWKESMWVVIVIAWDERLAPVETLLRDCKRLTEGRGNAHDAGVSMAGYEHLRGPRKPASDGSVQERLRKQYQTAPAVMYRVSTAMANMHAAAEDWVKAKFEGKGASDAQMKGLVAAILRSEHLGNLWGGKIAKYAQEAAEAVALWREGSFNG